MKYSKTFTDKLIFSTNVRYDYYKTTNEINYYIIPDSSHNAYCLPITKKESAVVINSGLIELLDEINSFLNDE